MSGEPLAIGYHSFLKSLGVKRCPHCKEELRE